MGDAGEGLIDSESRIQERMEEFAREKRAAVKPHDARDAEQLHALESLRLARTELERQFAATSHERRRAQLIEVLVEVNRRMAVLARGMADFKLQIAD